MIKSILILALMVVLTGCLSQPTKPTPEACPPRIVGGEWVKKSACKSYLLLKWSDGKRVPFPVPFEIMCGDSI
jgi:hypothetical protein